VGYRPWMSLAIGTLVPMLALAGVRCHINQIGSLDPFFYTSLILDFRDWVARYGDEYYTLRLAHIAPAALLTMLLGPVAGYLAYRAVLLSVISCAGWGLARRFGLGPALAAAATVWLAVNPPLLRSLLWDNPDGSALAWMFLTTAFLLGTVERLARGRVGTGLAFGAGVSYCLAANAYPLTGLVQLGLFGAVGLVLVLHGTRLRALALAAGVAVAGFGGAYLALVATRAVLLPGRPAHWDPLALTVVGTLPYKDYWNGGAVELLRGGGWALLVPVVFVVAGLLTAWRGGLLRRRRVETHIDRAVLVSLGYAAWTILLYVVLDRVWKMSVIRVQYHRIYATPALYLALLVLLSQVLSPRAQARNRFAAGIASVLLAQHFGGLRAYEILSGVPWKVYAALATLLLSLAALDPSRARRLRTVVVSLAVVLVPAVQLRGTDGGEPRSIYSSAGRGQWDLYRAAVALKEAVRSLPPDQGAIGFWYALGKPNLNSIQSIYSWNASRLSDNRPERHGMPFIEPDFIELMPGYEFVCILGENPAEMSLGRHALLALRPNAVSVRQGGWTGREYSAYFEVFDMRSR
jgi:hypothetical protein